MDAPARLRNLLLPFSWAYGAGVTLRNFLFDNGVFTIHRIDTPVISVGNITTGGTGKTPLVEHLATLLITMGLTPAFLSRGYGRTTRGTLVVSDGRVIAGTPERAGDEPVQIARKFPRCAVVVDERRARGARLIENTFHPDVILLDDGFQHRALHRDLDIVILDEEPDASGMHLLPAGNRREPMGSLRRAGLVVVNRRGGPTVPPPVGSPGTPAGRIVMNLRLKRLVDASTGVEVPIGTIRESECVAFCGIGNPGAFQRTLRENGISPAAFLSFGDHHRFVDEDLGRIDEMSDIHGARYILTTEKDAVRLDRVPGSGTRIPSGIVVTEIEVVIEEGGELVASALEGVRRRAA
jgi:tetraacyldisaccharide 4'-kinase